MGLRVIRAFAREEFQEERFVSIFRVVSGVIEKSPLSVRYFLGW